MDEQADWAVVLEEPWPSDVEARVSNWRNDYDPQRLLGDDDIRVEPIHTEDGVGSLRIRVRVHP